MFNNIIRILTSYRYFIIIILFYEVFYFLKNYKGNFISISKNNKMSDNIPCPYYFLIKIFRFLKLSNFKVFLDLGAGSGRILYFFNAKFKKKKFIGIEYFRSNFKILKKLFKKEKNIELIQADFTKLNLKKLNVDCFFLNNPFKNQMKSLKFIKKILKENKKKKKIYLYL